MRESYILTNWDNDGETFETESYDEILNWIKARKPLNYTVYRKSEKSKERSLKMKTTNIIIRCSERDKEILKKRAAEEQMTMSEYILNLIRIDEAKAH